MIRVVRRVVTYLGIAVVLWFVISRPDSAAALVRSVVGGIATAVDSGARFLAGVAGG